MSTDEFAAQQANAWTEIVGTMLEDKTMLVLNGGTVNGPGSSLEYTTELREALPEFLKKYNVATMLDCPCGDLTWLSKVDLGFLYSYIGIDSDPRIIDSNRMRYTKPNFTFMRANILTRARIPKVDLILCRDFLAHLPTERIESVIQKYKLSGSRYLLASNYPGTSNDFDHDSFEAPWKGYYERPHDLTAAPFNLIRLDGIPEESPPGGIISRQHELALFHL